MASVCSAVPQCRGLSWLPALLKQYQRRSRGQTLTQTQLSRYRITELIRLENTWRPSSPTHDLTPPYQLDPGTKCYIQSFLKYLQGRWFLHFPGQHILEPNHSFYEEFFPNLQPKFPLAQLNTVSSCPKHTGCLLLLSAQDAATTCSTTAPFPSISWHPLVWREALRNLFFTKSAEDENPRVPGTRMSPDPGI